MGTLVVEIHESGKLQKATAKGFHGLDHLKEVIVSGTAKKDSAGNLVLIAKGLHVR